MSQVGILLNDSTVDQLTEGVKLDHSQAILELTAEPCLKHACFFSLVSTWYPAYCDKVLKAWEYCSTMLLPCFRAKNSMSFLLITHAGM